MSPRSRLPEALLLGAIVVADQITKEVLRRAYDWTGESPSPGTATAKQEGARKTE